MRKLLLVPTIICVLLSSNASAAVEGNEFHGPVSTLGEKMCFDLALYAGVVMRERQYGIPKYAVENKILDKDNDSAILGGIDMSIIQDAYNYPLEPTKKLKENLIETYVAKTYLPCMQTISEFETNQK